LRQIALSFKKFQGKDKPIKLWIRIGDHVAFIIGDSQSQDKMCGRYLAYANVPRMCCECDVTPDESDDPNHVCNFISMHDIND